MEIFLYQILIYDVLIALCDSLGIPHNRAYELRTIMDEQGKSVGDTGSFTRFLPLSVFKKKFLEFLSKSKPSALQVFYHGLSLGIFGVDGCTPPLDGPMPFLPPFCSSVEEEEVDVPINKFFLPLYSLVPDSVYQKYGWKSAAEYAVYVSKPNNIVLNMYSNGQIVSKVLSEYEHESLPFSVIPQYIRDDMRKNGACFEDEDLFQINIVRAVFRVSLPLQ